MFKKKIENIWFFTAIYGLVVIILILMYRQITLLDIDSNIKVGQVKEIVPEEKEISLIFGGDVMLARTVEQKILKAGDYALPFRKIYEEFEKADLAFINLESPMYDGGSATPNGSMVFRALPDSIEGLTFAGIDIVSLANNHFGNQGVAGERYTFEHLKNNEIEYCGAGENFAEAHLPAIFEIEETRIAYLCYAYPDSMYIASEGAPGMANTDINQMKEDVNSLGEEVDFVIVSMHAGAEYTHNPGNFQVDFAHAAVDAGVDLVVGHHPHVVETTEKYKDGLILYSLGNLVFDQMWSEETQQGAVAKATLLGNELKSVEIMPVHIYDYNQPDWADEQETKQILEDMGLTSAIITLNEAEE